MTHKRIIVTHYGGPDALRVVWDLVGEEIDSAAVSPESNRARSLPPCLDTALTRSSSAA